MDIYIFIIKKIYFEPQFSDNLFTSLQEVEIKGNDKYMDNINENSNIL